jgi:hypothetical protein
LNYWPLLTKILPNSQKGASESETELLWQILDVFFGAPYWRRVWIIQEIAVALNISIVHGGTESRWEDVAEIISELREAQGIAPKHLSVYRNAFHVLEFRTRFKKRESIGILDAMKWSGHTLATDSRDKVFALLGLCHDGPTFVPLPNYKQPLTVAITDMVRTIMNTNHSLDLICLKGTYHPSKLAMPTWVPDLTRFWSSSMTIQEATFDQWQTTYSFNPILEGSSSRILLVKGKFLSRINSLSTGMRPDGLFDPPDASRNPWISLTSKLSDTNSEIRSATERNIKIRDRIWETLTMGLLRGTLSCEKLRGCFSTLWRAKGRGAVHNLALIAWIDQNAFLEVTGHTLREWSQTTSSAEKSILRTLKDIREVSTAKDFETFINTLERILSSGMRLAAFHRDFFLFDASATSITEGMVHPDAEPGDEVYLIQGCSIPVVLRRVKDADIRQKFRVIGGAYLLETDKKSKFYESRLANAWDESSLNGVRILSLL